MFFQLMYASILLLISVLVIGRAVTMNPLKYFWVRFVIALCLDFAAIWLASETELILPFFLISVGVGIFQTLAMGTLRPGGIYY